MGYGKPLDEVKRHSSVEQLTQSEREKREAEEAKAINTVVEDDSNKVVSTNPKAKKEEKNTKGRRGSRKKSDEEKAKPAETNAPTEHKDGTTTPPVGDDKHEYSGTADAPKVK